MNQFHPQYVVDEKGEPQGVLLAINEFEELLECAQDVLDLQETERLKKEPRTSWADVKSERESGARE